MGVIGVSEYPHALRPGDHVVWKQRDDVTTVLVVKDVKRISVVHAPPFYRSTVQTQAADFTHVIVTFKGLPFPCLFGPNERVLRFVQRLGSDID